MATKLLAVPLELELPGMSMALGRSVFARSSKRPRERSFLEAKKFWYVAINLEQDRNQNQTAANTCAN